MPFGQLPNLKGIVGARVTVIFVTVDLNSNSNLNLFDAVTSLIARRVSSIIESKKVWPLLMNSLR